MGRTNITTSNDGTDLFLRPYAKNKDDSYTEMTQTVTQAHADSQVVMPHSILSKPYLADTYGEMEYEFDKGDPYTFEYPEWVEPELEEDDDDTATAVIVYASADDGNVWQTQYTWEGGGSGAHDYPTGYGQNSSSDIQVLSAWAGPTTPSYHITRYFCDFDLTLVDSGDVNSVTMVLNYSGGIGENRSVCVQEGTQTPPILHNSDPGAPPVGQDTHYVAFTGSAFSFADGLYAAGTIELELNATGVNYVAANCGGIVKFCLRDYNYDYLNVEPVTVNPNTINTVFDFSGGDSGENGISLYII